MTIAEGEVVAERYLLERKLGEGGMGQVWAGSHVITHKRVALKFLSTDADDPASRERFVREARAACAVVHPHVIGVHDVLDHGPLLVMVLDLLAGESLEDRLQREGTIPLETTLEILSQVALALEAVHEEGIIHRDLKPGNVFLERGAAGEEVHVKVLDFGLARLTGNLSDAEDPTISNRGNESSRAVPTAPGRLTEKGVLMGTLCYMAPEQAHGKSDLDLRADLWALGIIAYECITGVCPTDGKSAVQIVMKVTTDPIAPIETVRPGLPVGIAQLVGSLLQRDPDARPASAREVRGRLEIELARLRDPAPPSRSTADTWEEPTEPREEPTHRAGPMSSQSISPQVAPTSSQSIGISSSASVSASYAIMGPPAPRPLPVAIAVTIAVVASSCVVLAVGALYLRARPSSPPDPVNSVAAPPPVPALSGSATVEAPPTSASPVARVTDLPGPSLATPPAARPRRSTARPVPAARPAPAPSSDDVRTLLDSHK